MAAQKITLPGFIDEFQRRHRLITDRPFCWILGSGASRESGIPTGAELALRWLQELHKQEDFAGLSLEDWATADNLDIPGFDFRQAANFYPQIYWRRYRDFPDVGFAFLESIMEKIEPSYGHSVLAQIMTEHDHKVVITTNFDNLVENAVSIYARSLPFVCGHESLTGFIRARAKRPLIAKVHRDLLLEPANMPDRVKELPPEWMKALRTIFQNYTPIVIGYGGNDGSLMNFLEALDPIHGGIFWCYRESGEPEAGIQDLVEHHRGRLVPILGFDELMLQLWQELGLPSPMAVLEQTHQERVEGWRKQFEKVDDRIKKWSGADAGNQTIESARSAAAAAVQRLTKEETWWAWELKARAEPDPAKQEAIYREGLEDFPNSASLTGNFALFMEKVRKDHDEPSGFTVRRWSSTPRTP